MDENLQIDPVELRKSMEELGRVIWLVFRPFRLAAHLLFETDPKRRHSLTRRIKEAAEKLNRKDTPTS